MKKSSEKSETNISTSELAEVTKQLARLNSFKFQFAMGLVRGTAVAIGTTLIAGLVLAALAQFVSSAEFLKITNQILEPYRK